MSYGKEKNIPEALLKAVLELNSLIIIGFSVLEYNMREYMVQVFVSNLGPHWLGNTLTEPGISLIKEEASIIERRQRKSYLLTERKFAEEASMGFWVELFNRESYKQLKGIPIQVFKYRPSDVKRSKVYQMLKYIKDLRNQLVHNRLMLNTKKETVSLLETLQKADNDVRTLISYINPASLRLLPQGISGKISEIEKLLP
jgi:hypothetical protein